MRKVAGLLMLIFVLLQSGRLALAQLCEYAGQTFSPGATICECPNLRIVRSATGGRGEITSRRLSCSKNQTWVSTNSLCLIAYTSADHAQDAFRKFQVSYCPRFPVNHAELLKAISEETEKFFRTAPRSQVLVAVETICRRYADLSESCKMMIETLSAAGNSAAGNPAIGKPATGNPATGSPATENPAIGNPATGD